MEKHNRAPMQGNLFPVKRNDILMWINLENITLTERKPDTKGHILSECIYMKYPA